MLYLLLLLLSLKHFLILVGSSVVCCLLVLVVSCICLFFMVHQGADTDAEQLALTDQLFDAALGEVSVVARGQPCSAWLVIFNVEPTKIPCLAKGISAGLWVDLEASWALASGGQPVATCKREWGSGGGHRCDFYGWLSFGCCCCSFLSGSAREVDCSSSCCSYSL